MGVTKEYVKKLVIEEFNSNDRVFVSHIVIRFKDETNNNVSRQKSFEKPASVAMTGNFSETNQILPKFKDVLSEVLWDLVAERIITPTIDNTDSFRYIDSFKLTNKEKLRAKLG